MFKYNIRMKQNIYFVKHNYLYVSKTDMIQNVGISKFLVSTNKFNNMGRP